MAHRIITEFDRKMLGFCCPEYGDVIGTAMAAFFAVYIVVKLKYFNV